MTEKIIDFPRMIYHIVEDPKVVFNSEDLQFNLNRGWSMTPETFSEVKALRAKIAYHQAEAERLADKLIEIEDKDTEEKEPIVGPADSITPESKKRGRKPHKATV
jgi:hypothetical protein